MNACVMSSAAVARRRIADVPLGAFLSGGLDSAIIATHLAECTPGPITTFSIGYAAHTRYDETPYARLMAKHLDSNHHELRVSYRDVLDTLEPMLDHLGDILYRLGRKQQAKRYWKQSIAELKMRVRIEKHLEKDKDRIENKLKQLNDGKNVTVTEIFDHTSQIGGRE